MNRADAHTSVGRKLEPAGAEPEQNGSAAKKRRVAMFASGEARCGIRDYTALLTDALRGLPEIEDVRTVPSPEARLEAGAAQAIRHFGAMEKLYRTLGEHMNADGADIAHVQHQYFFFGGVAPHKNHARAFLSAVRVPVVLTVHEIAQPKTDANVVVRQALALTNRRNFLHPNIRALIVHTENDREQLLALGARPERVTIVTHAIPPAAPLPDTFEAKRALGLEGRRVILLFGFLSAKKGHALAIDALNALPDDVTLLVAGDQHPQDHTDYVAKLRARINEQGLNARVRITGYLDEAQIPVVMAAAEVAIAPFAQSSGSGSLANLLAYGRAIVASDIAPHKIMAHDFPGCLDLFAAGDDKALAAHVLAVMDNAAQRASLQEAAVGYAKRHSYLHMAQETARIYGSLV